MKERQKVSHFNPQCSTDRWKCNQIRKLLINMLIVKYVIEKREHTDNTHKIHKHTHVSSYTNRHTHGHTHTHTHTAFWQMANHEVDRAVKQACSLCPPTQHFAQCVYQMAALYQGVADTGSTQSSVKQEYSRPLITGVLWLDSHHCQAARSYRCHSALRHLNGTFTAFCVRVLMSEQTRLSGDCCFLLVN